MISEYNGDIFLAPVNILVHQCNCFGIMGKGIAHTIKSNFPHIYDIDLTTPIGDPKKLGKYSYGQVNASQNHCLKYIVNLYGQYKYGLNGRYTSYDALDQGFRAIEEEACNTDGVWYQRIGKPPIVAVPYKIGCGFGGGSWPVVYAIMKDIFENSKISLVICKMN